MHKEYIVDEDGVLVLREDDNKIMVREAMELGVDFDTYEELKEQADYIKEQIELWEYNSREAIKKVLKKNKAKSLKTKYRTFTLVSEKLVPSIDSERLKKEQPDIYNQYSKFTQRAEHLRVTKRKE